MVSCRANLSQFVYSCFLLFSLTFSGSLSAQVDLTPLVGTPVVSTLSTKEGLVQDSIKELYIDKDGFLWIATDGGLDRFDGHRVEHIGGPDDMLASTPIITVYQDSRNNMWIGTFYRGVYTLDLNTGEMEQQLTLPYLDDDEYLQEANRFIELPDGKMLILFSQSLIRFDPETKTVESLYSVDVSQDSRVTILRDMLVMDNLLVLATSDGVVVADYLKPRLHFQPVEHLPPTVSDNLDNTNTKFLHLSDDGTLWVGTVAGLYTMPWDNLQLAVSTGDEFVSGTKQIVEQRNIWQLRQQDGDKIWLGTDIGLMQLTQQSKRWEVDYVMDPSSGTAALSRQDIRAMTITQSGDIWIGTYFGGAMYWSPKSLNFNMIQNQRRMQLDNVLSDNTIWAIYQDNEDIIWAGTDNGLTRYNQKQNTSDFFLVNPGIPDPYSIHSISRILPAPDPNKLIVSTLAGMLLFDKRTGDYELLEFGLEPDESIWLSSIAYDSQQRLYFLGEHYYRYDFSKDEFVTLDVLQEQIPLKFIANFIGPNPSDDSEMLVSTFEGLWSFNVDTLKARQLHKLPESARYTDYAPGTALVDGHIMWVSYPGYGLVGLDTTTFEERYYFGRDALGSGAVLFDLIRDDDGYIWFSSLDGIHRFSPAKQTFTSFYYGRELSIAEFNQGAKALLNDGRIAYGSPRGILTFNPLDVNKQLRELQVKREVKQMVISGVGLSSRELGLPKKNLANVHLELYHEDYGLTIEFSSLEYNSNEDTSYKYILSSGSQVLSQDVTRDTKVVLPSLPAGDYRFEVMPASQHAERAILPVSLTVSVAYPPLLSPLAYSIYALVILVLLGSYLMSRHIQLLRLKQAQQQVKLFGNAFRHTSDWVVIFDRFQKPVAANPAFEKAFGLTPRDRLDKQLHRLYQQVPRLERQLSGQLALLDTTEAWKGEERIQLPDGRQYDVLIDINKMQGDKEQHDIHYLVVISNITEQKNAERKLVKVANFDSLTGLVNRSLLLDRLEHAIDSAAAHDHTVAVLFVDLDRFKGINDSLGHDYGDKLLRVIANRMLNQASKSDTVARLGGDEFVIVMEEVESESAVSHFVTQLIESIETPISLGKEVLRVSCSVGISFFPDDATEPAELLKQADVAMYTAKKSTLNAFIYYTTEMNQRAIERLALENRVKSAYEDQAFINYYQPIVNLETGKTEGVELLLRCHYNDEWISPSEFIPVLEELRHIIELTRQATAKAITDLKSWYELGYDGYVSINLSALHFKTHFDLDYIEDLLAQAQLPNSAIRFEITEGVLIDKSDEVLSELNRIRDSGFKMALDDFGTGYSSLSYLRRFPLNILKIDKSFIDDIKGSLEENALVQTTINLALSLNMDCIAEGIEHPEQVHFLLNHGCIRQQGYYFSKPVDAATIPPLLTQQWLLPPAAITG